MSTVSDLHQKISPGTVHKDTPVDVLISNGRGATPTFIDERVLAHPALTEADASRLRELYRPGEELGVPDSIPTRRYLRSVPHALTRSQSLRIESESDSALLLSYFKIAQDGAVLGSRFMDEVHEQRLMGLFVDRSRHLTSRDRSEISRILDRLGPLDRPEIFNVDMFVDIDHYFFYRKVHEHVPGIMLVEAARQCVYTQFYRYSGHSKETVTLTIKALNCCFDQYVNAYHPVQIRVEDEVPRQPDQRYAEAKSISLRMTFYQNERRVAAIVLSSDIIRLPIFHRLRDLQPPDAQRFTPSASATRSAVVTTDTGQVIDCTINDLSSAGANVTLATRVEGWDGARWQLHFFAEGSGILSAILEPRWVSQGGADRMSVGARIIDIPIAQQRRYREFLKNKTHVKSDRYWA